MWSMGDRSKRDKRLQQIHDFSHHGQSVHTGEVFPQCWCGQPAKYEVNRGAAGVEFYCTEHLPKNALEG